MVEVGKARPRSKIPELLSIALPLFSTLQICRFAVVYWAVGGACSHTETISQYLYHSSPHYSTLYTVQYTLLSTVHSQGYQRSIEFAFLNFLKTDFCVFSSEAQKSWCLLYPLYAFLCFVTKPKLFAPTKDHLEISSKGSWSFDDIFGWSPRNLENIQNLQLNRPDWTRRLTAIFGSLCVTLSSLTVLHHRIVL